MSKPDAVPVPGNQPNEGARGRRDHNGSPEPLSGSKKVKNANHSRSNHGEGS